MATRLYIGGLGERVTEDDLRRTFSNLGCVETVDIIRTKGRSFAYINFLPSSDNSLPKLFSTYNGCSWKGGKLRIEKAKEHYIDRLQREWAEDAELIDSNINHVDIDEDMLASPKPMSTLELEKAQLRIFFPKLRKVKSLPLRGTGKHKYSFQRVEAPRLPVHFCDCPEHSDPLPTPKVTPVQDSRIQDGGINEEEINMMNSVMNRLLEKETGSESERFLLPRETHVPDSNIQDGSMNDEEINVMNSVMKKPLDRETTLQIQQETLHDSLQPIIPTSEFQEDSFQMDDGSDDDDIKINMVAGQNFGSFPSEIWEQQTSLIARPDGLLAYDSATKSKPDYQTRKVKPSNKRKIISTESTEENLASPIHKKKARLPTQSKESEELMELKSVAEPETMKSSMKGMWSQKSAWRKLVGDGGSSSFTLSRITTGGETNNEVQPKPDNETSSESKRHKGVSNIGHANPKSGDERSPNSEEHELVNNCVHENLGGQSSESKEREGLLVPQPVGQSADSEKAIRGSSWLQKSSWTQLVGGGNNSSFSISQILPGNLLLEKQQLQNPNGFNTNTGVSSGITVKEPRTSETTVGGSRGSKSILAGSSKKMVTQPCAPNGNNLFDSTVKKSDLEAKQASKSVPGVAIGESCSFMRSADSLKEWQTAKTALSGTLKKRNNNK